MFLIASDTISGQDGKATATIEGMVHDLFMVKSFQADFDKRKVEIKTLGKKNVQHKSVGWSGSGSMSMYYITSIFRKMALQFARTGRDIYFNITVVNHDAGSSVGSQTVVFYNCNLDSTVLARLDVDSDALEDDVAFTYDDFDILDAFGKPVI